MLVFIATRDRNKKYKKSEKKHRKNLWKFIEIIGWAYGESSGVICQILADANNSEASETTEWEWI